MARQRRSRAVLLAAAFALVVASCAPAAIPSGPTGSTPAPSQIAEPSQTIAPTSAPSANPTGVAPVTPASDRAVLRLEIGSDIAAPTLALVLYADGSLVDLRSTPPVVWSLSTGGVELVVSRLRASGLFTTSHTIPRGSAPMGFGLFNLTLIENGTAITVRGSNLGDDPETKALTALADGLVEIDRWLPGTAFVDGDLRPHPFVPGKARVTSEVVALPAGAWTNPEHAISKVAWSLDVAPSQLGERVVIGGRPDRSLRCGLIDGAVERVIRLSLAPIESQALDQAGRVSAWDIWLDGPALLRLTLQPFLPDEVPACAAADLPTAPSLATAQRPSLAALLNASASGLTPAERAPDLVATVIDPAVGEPIAQVSYYADGTVLFRDPTPPAVGIGARRLSTSGFNQVQQLLAASGLLKSNYSELVPEGTLYGHMYSIVTPAVILNATDRGKDPRATAITKLAADLAGPVAWLPTGAWSAGLPTIKPFKPASINLVITPAGMPTEGGLPSITSLRWPLDGTWQTFGEPEQSVPGTRSGSLSGDEAARLVTALLATGARPSGCGPVAVQFILAASEPASTMQFELWIVGGEFGP